MHSEPTYTAAEATDTDIAIVGMAGRFPGAPDVDTLWRRVRDAEDCLVTFSRDELLARGVPSALVDDPEYVRRNGVLDDLELFDAGFFGFGPRDASIMDPQHRHFIECAWDALETSGHVPERFAGAIGVFAGCGMNTYLLNNLLTNPTLVDQVGMFLIRHTANDKDFLTTTASYRLDLRGPSVNVQTACSTSLVAVHLAVQSLLAFECDLALAGGSTIEVPHRVGYVYHEGEILSSDGYCRAFDERSAGTVLTSGAGVVALRRLADALEDGDPILAIVKATAINNDGQRKVGYLAPSVDGHADVVKEALAVAGLSARDLQLFEAHGTGTAVGDPIEVAALTEAYRASTPDTGYCRLVSTKPNIGHLDTAAGVASLVKVVQAMRHRTLPPLANHTAPSPLLDLERTPFVIEAEASPWRGDRPRRAGISSLGVGGTNAHVIVQEAPELPPTPPAVPEQVLAISGRDAGALDDNTKRLADFLTANPEVNLADVAHTLAAGRRAHAHRRVVVATDVPSAIEVLRTNDRNRIATSIAPDDRPRVAFLLPGGGAQYNGMASGLDDRFDVFHEVMRDGLERIRARFGVDLASLLRVDAAPDALLPVTASMPAIFLTSVALARQWMAWGVNPTAFVGHSLGEYTCAHLAGVLTLDGALDLIVARATLIDRVSGHGAAMLAVPMPEADVRAVLSDSLSLATINADDECVVAGPAHQIAALQARLTADEISPSLIPIAAASHSSMLEPILSDFLAAVRGVELSPPHLPYLSNLTGTWITAEQATDPQYWVDHLRHTVRFSDCLRTVLADGPLVLMELGPGHALSSYARRQTVKPVAAIPALRHQNQEVDDTAYTLNAFARGWAAGVDVDLDRFTGPGRRFVRLPGYAFRKERHWIEPGDASPTAGAPRVMVTATTSTSAAMVAGPARITDLADELWAPRWVEAEAVAPPAAPVGPWLVLGNAADPFVDGLARELTTRGGLVEVTAAPHPAQLGAARSVVLAGPTRTFDEAVDRWLTMASAAARALGDADGAPTLLAAITRGATDVTGAAMVPADAMALGVIGTAPHEYSDLRTVLVDLEPNGTATTDVVAVVRELFGASDRVVARRGLRRLVPSTERVRIGPVGPDATTFRRGGNYLVTGGLGGVGFALARHLVERHEANVAIVASRPVPEGVERAEFLRRRGYDDPTSRRIRRLAELESFGTKVTVVTADLADPAAVRAAVERAGSHLGRLDGAVHAAGELRDRPIELATHDDHAVVLGAKALGALTLVDELRRTGAELLLLVSSTSTVLMPEGQAAYVAANSVLDALAGQHGDLRVVTVNYGLWGELGIAAAAAHRARLGIEPGEPVSHPVLSERVVDRSGTVRLVGTLATGHHWVVDEHRTAAGIALLPGTAHLELFLAALHLSAIDDAGLGPVSLVEPLVVPDGVPVTVRVSVRGTGDDRSVQLESDGGVGSWRLHSEAEVVARSARPDLDPPTRPADAVDVDPLARPGAQLELGPRWSCVADAWRVNDDVAARLALDRAYAGEVDAWMAHPALVDVATACGVLLGDRQGSLYVPIGYGGVTSWASLPAAPWVRATRRASATSEVLEVDLLIGDDDGVVLRIDGLALHPIDDPTALAVEFVQPEPSATDGGHRMGPLVALAERHGIRAAEGAELVERLVASHRPRLIASSLELEDLLGLMAAPSAPTPGPASAVDGAAAAASVAGTVRAIWINLLGIDDIADDADFFDAGGHSLIAIRLMSRIHKELGVRFQLATIFDAPTIAALARLVLEARPDLDAELAASAAVTSTTVVSPAAAESTASEVVTVAAPPEHRSLVTISASGDKAPLFIVHGAGGNVLFLWSLARAMAGSRPIYGFQARGVDGTDMPDATIEEMAARYVAELRARHRGPYLLGGYSGGGVVTYEMVRQLQALGEVVHYVVMFDSVPPGRANPARGPMLRNLFRHLRRQGLGPLKPFIRYWLKSEVKRFLPMIPTRAAELASEERDLGLRDVEGFGFVDLFYYFSASAERYRMATPVRVDAAILKAEWVWPTQPDDYYWSRYLTGQLDIASVPGDHNAMFYPEHAPRLVEVLQPLLDAHEPRRGST